MNKLARNILITVAITIGLLFAGFFCYTVVNQILHFENIQKGLNKPLVFQTLTREHIDLTSGMDKVKRLQLGGRDTIYIRYWATWCQPCIEKIDKLDSLPANHYFVTLEEIDKLKAFAEQKNYPFPLYRMGQDQIPYEPQEVEFYPSTAIVVGDSVMVKILQ